MYGWTFKIKMNPLSLIHLGVGGGGGVLLWTQFLKFCRPFEKMIIFWPQYLSSLG